MARFHLGNGAELEAVHWMGDVSEKGIDQAAGLMVNYRYRLDRIEANHEAYAKDGRDPGVARGARTSLTRHGHIAPLIATPPFQVPAIPAWCGQTKTGGRDVRDVYKL